MEKRKKNIILLICGILLLIAYFLNIIYLSDSKEYNLVVNAIIFLFILLEFYERKKEYSKNIEQNLIGKIIKCLPIISGLIVIFSLIYVFNDLQHLHKIYFMAYSINIMLFPLHFLLYNRLQRN